MEGEIRGEIGSARFFLRVTCEVAVTLRSARLAQSVERKTLRVVVVDSRLTVGDCFFCGGLCHISFVWCLRCITITSQGFSPDAVSTCLVERPLDMIQMIIHVVDIVRSSSVKIVCYFVS